MGQIQFSVALVMIALFSIAVIGFAISFANTNTVYVDISDDTEMLSIYDDTSDNVAQYGSDAEDTYQSIVETTIEPGAQTFQSSGPFSITPRNLVNTVTNIFYVGYQKVFGTGGGFGIFFTAFAAVLVFIIGLYVYKTLRGGLPD